MKKKIVKKKKENESSEKQRGNSFMTSGRIRTQSIRRSDQTFSLKRTLFPMFSFLS